MKKNKKWSTFAAACLLAFSCCMTAYAGVADTAGKEVDDGIYKVSRNYVLVDDASEAVIVEIVDGSEVRTLQFDNTREDLTSLQMHQVICENGEIRPYCAGSVMPNPSVAVK